MKRAIESKNNSGIALLYSLIITTLISLLTAALVWYSYSKVYETEMEIRRMGAQSSAMAGYVYAYDRLISYGGDPAAAFNFTGSVRIGLITRNSYNCTLPDDPSVVVDITSPDPDGIGSCRISVNRAY